METTFIKETRVLYKVVTPKDCEETGCQTVSVMLKMECVYSLKYGLEFF